MIGAFSKEEYWKQRNAPADQQKMLRQLARFEKRPVIAHHDKPDWTPKQVSKKAIRKNTRRARKVIIA